VRQLLRVWKHRPAAKLRTEELLRIDLASESSRQVPEQELFQARIRSFDTDASISSLVANGLRSLESHDQAVPLPSRDQFYHLRQEILEDIFLPSEDDVTWAGEIVAGGLDSLATIEKHRQNDVAAIEEALSKGPRAEGGTSPAPAPIQLGALSQLDGEAAGLYGVAYLGLRIFVRLPPFVAPLAVALTTKTGPHPPSTYGTIRGGAMEPSGLGCCSGVDERLLFAIRASTSTRHSPRPSPRLT